MEYESLRRKECHPASWRPPSPKDGAFHNKTIRQPLTICHFIRRKGLGLFVRAEATVINWISTFLADKIKVNMVPVYKEAAI